MKNSESKSWVLQVDQVLPKYSLPSAHDLLTDPPSKSKWKGMVRKAVLQYWRSRMIDEAGKLSSRKYISVNTLSPDTTAQIWSSSLYSPTLIKKAFLKVKLLTKCYKLQCHEALFKRNQHSVDPTCKLCAQEPEDLPHFIVRCSELQSVRSTHEKEPF